MDKNSLADLRVRKADLLAVMKSMTDGAAGASRNLSDIEQKRFDALANDVRRVNVAIGEKMSQIEAGRVSSVGGRGGAGRITSVRDRREEDPRRGFASFGEFAQTVILAGRSGGVPDKRLLIGAAAPSTFGDEGSGVEGGFAVPPQFARDIFMLSLGEDSLVPLTDNTEIGGNSMVFPKDETTPWGTDGIRAYWQDEATAANATKPKLGTSVLRLHKLMALVPLTDELLADTNALDSYLPKKVGSSIRWKTNDAIVNGNGAGQPLGYVNSGAVVTVSKDSGQSTGTLTITNLANMMAQLPPGSFRTAAWLIHDTVLGSLFSLNSNGIPYYLPMGGGKSALASSPYGALLGRPIILSQHANVFSSIGDVQLVDLSYYRTISKAAGVETATSMHLYFDADATAFRAIFRVDGQPKISAPITQANSSTKLSPFLQLAAR